MQLLKILTNYFVNKCCKVHHLTIHNKKCLFLFFYLLFNSKFNFYKTRDKNYSIFKIFCKYFFLVGFQPFKTMISSQLIIFLIIFLT